MGSDAEYMYENNLDPFYRKDPETGKLVEWEGGLNPAYEDDGESYSLYDESDSEDPLNINQFETFEEAKAWAKENPGRSFIKSPYGTGYIVKDSTSESNDYNFKGISNKRHGNIRPSVYEKIKDCLTRDQLEAECSPGIISMSIAPELAGEILRYINDNDFLIESYKHNNYNTHRQGDIDPYIKGNSQLRNNRVEAYFAPNFALLKYFKRSAENNKLCFMCILKQNRAICPSLKRKEQEKRCKTLEDFYFEILNKYPNKLIDIMVFHPTPRRRQHF